MIEPVRDSLIHMIHTHDGAHATMNCLWHGTKKDRKVRSTHVYKKIKFFYCLLLQKFTTRFPKLVFTIFFLFGIDPLLINYPFTFFSALITIAPNSHFGSKRMVWPSLGSPGLRRSMTFLCTLFYSFGIL